MFNDLNQNNQPTPKMPPVDDIFAETDKTEEAKKFSGYYSNSAAPTPAAANPTDIDAQKAGLSSSDDLPSKSKGKIIKIGLIVLLVLLLIGLGYLIYVKFFAGQTKTPDAEDKNIVNVVTTTANNIENNVDLLKSATTSSDNTNWSSTEASSTASIATSTTPISEEVVSATSTPLATTTPPVSNLTDTDGDGLTDEEENNLGTNINKVDTDGDGLPDYEEVKVYGTDPLKADTDGDGHNDGEEIKNGYNPLGAGKLIDAKK